MLYKRTSGPPPQGVATCDDSHQPWRSARCCCCCPHAQIVVGHQGPCDDVITVGRGSPITTPPTTTTVPAQPTTTTVPARPTSTTSGVASEATVREVTVAEPGEELPFTETRTTVTLAAAGVFMAAGALAFLAARTKPTH